MIDKQYLQQLTGGDIEFQKQLLQQFIETTLMDLSNLERAVLERNLKNIHHFSHRIKGSAQLLNLSVMIEKAKLLENSSESLPETTLHICLEELQRSFKVVRQYINGLN